MKMPTFNIFITMSPEKEDKEDKKEKKKDSALSKALKRSSDNEDEMLAEMKVTNDKLRRLPLNSHVGGG